MSDRVWLLALTLGVAALALYGFVASGYGLNVLRDALIFALLAASLDFFWGGAGILSFGHAVFFGAGGYVMALVTLNTNLPAVGLVGLVGAALAAALIAAVVGYFLFFGGVRGSYFTIVTLALSVIAQQAAVSWSSVTGGDSGLLGIPQLAFAIGPFSLDLSGDRSSYVFVVVVLAATLLGLRALSRGRWGRILTAIGDNEVRAAALGHNAALRLTLTFVLSAAVAGLAGAIYVAMAGLMAPDLSGLLLSTEAVIWVAIGGRGTLLGPVIGAVVAQRAQQVISSYNPSLWPLIIGCIFVVMVFALPDGVTPALQRGWARLRSAT
jgi:branched-chain amino acid transport system permease protein